MEKYIYLILKYIWTTSLTYLKGCALILSEIWIVAQWKNELTYGRSNVIWTFLLPSVSLQHDIPVIQHPSFFLIKANTSLSIPSYTVKNEYNDPLVKKIIAAEFFTSVFTALYDYSMILHHQTSWIVKSAASISYFQLTYSSFSVF